MTECSFDLLMSVCVCSPRPGVRLPHAEAPVHVWKHQQPPGARRPHPEHLVAAAGDGAASAVRGGKDNTRQQNIQ